MASIAGASASLVVSAPLDVIKTRIQNRNFDNPEGGFRILSNMARQEGFSSFFKGLVPKVWRNLCWWSHARRRLSLTSDVAVAHDGTQAGLFFLARPDAHPGLRCCLQTMTDQALDERFMERFGKIDCECVGQPKVEQAARACDEVELTYLVLWTCIRKGTQLCRISDMLFMHPAFENRDWRHCPRPRTIST